MQPKRLRALNSLDVPPARARTAIALSLVAHLCALWLLAVILGERQMTLSSTPAAGFDPLTVTVISVVHRERVPHRRVVLASSIAVGTQPAADARRSAPPRLRAPVRAAIVSAALTDAKPTARPQLPPPVFASSAAPTRLAVDAAPTRRPVVAAAPTRPPVVAAAATPPPVVTPAPTAASSPATQPNFGGLFSQDYPPALVATADLADIRSRLGGKGRIRVDVDESGRATDVVFVDNVDPALAEELRSELLALRYVPADCNGLHCAGRLEISF